MIGALCDSWYVCGWLVVTVVACVAIASTFVMRDPTVETAPRSKGDGPKELKLRAPPVARLRPQPQPAAPTRPRPTALALPNPEAQLALIRLHLVALDQAIQANDFRVLHAISAPRLRYQMTAEQLARAFATLAARRFDGAAAITVTPQITRSPRLLPGNVLNVVGYVPAPRQRIDFHMQFEHSDRRWRLLAMNVAARPLKRTRAKSKSAAPPKARRKRKKAKQDAGAITPRRRHR